MIAEGRGFISDINELWNLLSRGKNRPSALATNIGGTFVYENGKESRGGAGEARDARAA